MNQKAEDLINQANRELIEGAEPPMTIDEYVQRLVDDPSIARTAHQYLLDAIDYFGTRTVFERGEEKERYCFFDDPANDGEHAVLGNTDTLNSFVNDLRVIADSEDRMQKIILFSGPTATGKSELKRCTVNGLREYSKKEEGKRYTCDWNITTMNSDSEGLSYNSPRKGGDTDESTWYESPVQGNPFSVLPRGVREEVASQTGQNGYLPTDMELDPFSAEAYEKLRKNYQHATEENLFSQITTPNHFRVRRYVLDETQGIGILAAEDDGSVKERLLGSWMPSMLQQLDSRGRKDPRAFSYDGVLSQGNGGVTVVEDATKHTDVLLHLLNIPDEGHAKIDKEIGFDVDTVPIFISNPDLMSKLKEAETGVPLEKIHGIDPLKAVKRRLFQYSFKYLTGYSSESELLRKEIQGYTDKLKNGEVSPRNSLSMNETEFAPHLIEAIAMYDVVTRLMTDNLPEGLNLVDKALLFDRGFIETEDGRKSIEDYDLDDLDSDGEFGVPVTYSRDILRAMVHSGEDDKQVYLPHHALDKVVNGLSETPVFAHTEAKKFKDRAEVVRKYVNEQQEEDVIESILSDRQATEGAVSEYVDNLYEWEDGNQEKYDPYLLKDFETRHLGTTEEDYDGQKPRQSVVELRNERIISPLNRYHWRQRNNEFESRDSPLSEVPVLSSLLGEYSWTDVFTTYENVEPINWESPPENTQTSEVKQKCIENMIDMFDYSEESARLTSEKVFVENKEKLLEIKRSVN